jgi:hypothetical protein
MLKISCTVEEFYYFIGPRIKSDILAINKFKKAELNFICEHCDKKNSTLDTVYKHGISRKKVIQKILEKNLDAEKKIDVPNLKKILDEIKKEFKSNNILIYLCQNCHGKYDKVNGKVGTKDLKILILKLFKENSKKRYTPKMIMNIIKERDIKFFAGSVWHMWKKGFLVHEQRKYYRWNEAQDQKNKKQEIPNHFTSFF